MSSKTVSFPTILRFSLLLGAILLLISSGMLAQTTVGTGSIVGTVTDPSGAVLSGARVTITNTQTSEAIILTTNSAGSFNSGALTPSSYRVQVSVKGFKSSSIPVTVQVGNTSTANARLELGQENQVVEVQGSDVQVNTEQATVQGVLNSAQIENLPVNGRNFLDLAQLEPGVQIQDGQNFDPTKAGYSSISFGGRFGRTARIYVDGVDISDETVGTTTEDIPASAISEFQLSQSSLDLSNDLTSSGAVNVTTKSGTNKYHGEAFGLFRDASVGGASSPGGTNLPTQRSQFGGSFGGAIIKDKMFFFLDGERTKQDSLAPVTLPAPFTGFNGGFTQPFRESNLLGKLDYNLGHNAHLFYRYTYFANSLFSDFGLGYAVYDNKDYTRNHVVGLDFNTGSYTHSIRFSYLKFQNQIVDAVAGSSLPLAGLGATISGSNGFYVGPSPLAPQSTPQSNRQIKYDGSKAIHSHILRYGASFNRVQGGGFASFYGSAPRITFNVTDTTQAFAATGPYPGGDTNPLNYPVRNVLVGNGQGFNTLNPALGFPAGGLGPDNRVGLYLGDNWKIRRNLTVSIGVRYDRDTGRTDSDLAAIPEINTFFPGYGNPVKQANANLAPQFGFAWDPMSNGKTSIRGGVGLYYENIIFNNVLFDRPYRLQTGAFNQVSYGCFHNSAQPVPTNAGPISPDAAVCDPTTTVGADVAPVLSFWHQVLAGNPLDLQATNPNYIGGPNWLGGGFGTPLGLFGPNYKSPRSVQMNFGIQREIRNGMVLSADYLRNVETHSLLGIDANHDGDVKNFNLTAAQNAITATNGSFGCATVDCSIAAGATIDDFAVNGLTTDSDFGEACIGALGVPCAFGGKNPNQPRAIFLQPIARSVYNALQLKLTQNIANPVRGLKALNFQLAYSLSRFENSGGAAATGLAADSDQDFVLQAADFNTPNKYFGPSLLDRTHQFSFGGYVDAPAGFRIGLIGHFYSPLSTSLITPTDLTSNSFGEIFRSDFSGDGTTGDPLPGTRFGNFDRGINAGNINQVINNYNTNVAGTATPAGQVLIKDGLMTLSQLQALGAVAQPVATAPSNQVDYTWLRAMDLKIAWRHTFKERFTVEPSVGFFNLLNFGNFNLPPNTINGILEGAPGSINGTTPLDNEAYRVGNGTGVYALGAARQIEWGLRLTF